MNPNCTCPKKCIRHGNCAECQAFHSDTTKVLNFCKWAKLTEFNEADSKVGVRAWLTNDRTPFEIHKWTKKK